MSLHQARRGGDIGQIEEFKKPVDPRGPLRAGLSVGGSPRALIGESRIQPGCEPFHFGPIGLGFFGNHDVSAGENLGESAEHPVRPAQNLGAQFRVGFVKPIGEANAAGHAVDFGDGESVVGENKVGSDDFWNVSGDSMFSLEGDELGRLAGVQQIGHPRGLAAFHALAIKLVAGAQEEGEAVSEFLEFVRQPSWQTKRCWCDAPFLFMKKPACGHGGLDGARRFQRTHESTLSAWRMSSSEVGVPSPVFSTARIALCASTCL